MPRLFIAIKPPDPLIDQLLDTMGDVAGARWQNRDQLHLTLEFLGDVAPPAVDVLHDGLLRIRHQPMSLSVAGVGHFEDRGHPIALWAAVGPHDALGILARKVRAAARRAGLRPVARRFVPHITLARLNRSCGPIADFLARHSDLRSADHPVDRFGLYLSEPGAQGSVYRCLASFPLGGPA